MTAAAQGLLRHVAQRTCAWRRASSHALAAASPDQASTSPRCTSAVQARCSSSNAAPGGGYANVIDAESGKTLIQGYFGAGFIVNNVTVYGPVVASADLWAHWRPRSMNEITPESLALLDLLTPPPEVLLLGCGRTSQPLGRPVQEFLRARGIAYEALDTRNAVSTFNFLNNEGRAVVAALLPYGDDEAAAAVGGNPAAGSNGTRVDTGGSANGSSEK